MAQGSTTAMTMMIAAIFAVLVSGSEAAMDVRRLRRLAARNNLTCVLVFGDSSVDPGNNNHLETTMKANFPPYGIDFFRRRPTGRFSNGRLVTDFVAEALGYTNVIPAFLDRNRKREEVLLHGVSFASGASGYDDLTSNLSNVLAVSKQLEYFRHYKIQLRRMAGKKKADEIVRGAVFVMSMGTNDFLQNYYLEPYRSKQYTVEQYQNYLTSSMVHDIKEMRRLGARRLVVVGVPPVGCMPLVRTLMDESQCVDTYDNAALSFNGKAKEKLAALRAPLSMKTVFVDAFTLIKNAINNPHQYGFTETSKGCCGSGTVEFSTSCQNVSTCSDPSKYVFWDAVHPTERMYKVIADEVLSPLNLNLLL